MAEPAAVLVAAVSGRALAASARRAGYLPLVTDFFGDHDTLSVAHEHVRLDGTLKRGIEATTLLAALDRLTARHHPIGIVYGTGFEDRPHLVQSLAQRWRVFGNAAATIARIKDPESFASLCADADIPSPEVSSAKPKVAADWLLKRRGGAGGVHIKQASQGTHGRGETYYQRKVFGTPVSALLLADGTSAGVLGFSAQWSLPTPRRPYRYGGAVRPAPLAPDAANKLTAAVERLAAMLKLVGLNSADFLVDGDSYWLLEVNPRPGATLDIFEPPEESLFAMHMAACAGTLSMQPTLRQGAEAAAIVYAEQTIASFPALDWPHWTADRPVGGARIEAGGPLCTVYACSPTAAGARALAEQRRKMVLAWTRMGTS